MREGKRGQAPFVRSTRRAVPAKGACPPSPTLRNHKCNQRRSVARKYLADRVRNLKPHDRRVARRLIEVAHEQFPHLTKARGRPASIGNSEPAAATGGAAKNGAATGNVSMSYVRGE